MTRSEELRQELTDKLAIAIANYEKYGGDEFLSQHVLLDYITAQRLHTILTEPVKWLYCVNEEGKARWKCSACGAVKHKNPYYKRFCSQCGRKVKLES